MQERTSETAAGDTEARMLDPVDYAVISQALIAMAREMGTKLIRSSYSNIVREAQDASAALFDAAGNVVAQAELIPMHLGSMSEIFRACVERCPIGELRPGVTAAGESGTEHRLQRHREHAGGGVRAIVHILPEREGIPSHGFAVRPLAAAYQRDGVYLEDAGSTNGTFVNGIRMTHSRRLAPGDVIKVGLTELRFDR